MKRDTELINIAAQIVRLEYLPSLDRCRTIQDARREVARMSEQHIVLALKLKELAGVPGETQSRGSQRCCDCGGIVTKNTGPVVLGRCNQCHQARGPVLTQCPQCHAQFKSQAGICMNCQKTLTPIAAPTLQCGRVMVPGTLGSRNESHGH